jgi:hypothetical protein
MHSSRPFSTVKQSAGANCILAKPLAPEEVRIDDLVTVLHITHEYPSFFWCAESFQIPHSEPVRVQFIPDDGGLPLKVRSICLPFVFVKDPAGEPRTLDLRKCRLARLDRDYAKTIWKARKKARAKQIF